MNIVQVAGIRSWTMSTQYNASKHRLELAREVTTITPPAIQLYNAISTTLQRLGEFLQTGMGKR